MAELKPCRNCAGREWVCENHRDTPWTGLGDPDEDECCGGAGAPCPVCSPEMACTGYINRATRTLAEAGDRLAGYAGHDRECWAWTPNCEYRDGCTCGLDQALADWRKAKGEV